MDTPIELLSLLVYPYIVSIPTAPSSPAPTPKNGALYEKYKELAKKEDKVIFGGRLGEYKYYDMDAVIASA